MPNRSIARVQDITVSEVVARPYDVAIFASGYESRSRAVGQSLKLQRPGCVLVFGFDEFADKMSRKANDEFFQSKYDASPLIVPTDGAGMISTKLDEVVHGVRDQVRILVDISSMSRAWYADIINWARFSGDGPRSVIIDFCYGAGEYPQEYPPRLVSKTSAIFGFEGRADTRLETVALIGLGFDPVTPHAILEDLQPERKYGFVAGNDDDAAIARSIHLNATTIEELDGPVVVIPLLSIESAYRILSEMAAPHAGLRNCVFIALGPKPHVLASLLVAARHEEVSCLHVKGRSLHPFDVRASGEFAFVSAHFLHVEGAREQIRGSRRLATV